MYNDIREGPALQDDDLRQQLLLKIKSLKVIGSIHIALGVVIAVLSTICIIIATVTDDMIFVGAACLPLSGWFIMTGALPLCMTEKREKSWKCLKTAFMVCCILSAVLFGFTVTSLAAVGIVISYGDNKALFVVFVLLTITAFNEVLLAIGGASYSCCCSHLPSTNHTRILPLNSFNSGFASIPQAPMPLSNSQGQNIWLIPGQHHGQPVMYHVVGVSPS